MRYLTWKLTWPDNAKYGFGPEPIVAENGGRLEASSWVNPTVENGTILGYLTGDFNVALLSAWDVAELTQNEALTFARLIDPDAYIVDNGIIASPNNIPA